MVEIKRGAEWDYDREAEMRQAAKSAPMEGNRVERPATIPSVGKARSSFAIFEALVAVAIERRRLRNSPHRFDIDNASFDPKYSSRSAQGRYPGYGGK